MSLYEFYKTIHILAAMAWVGAVILAQVQMARVKLANDPRRWTDFIEEEAWLGPRYFAPASMITLLAGIAMVVMRWEFTDLWIIIGIVGLVITVALGMGFLGPESERIKAALAAKGLQDTEVQERIKKIVLGMRLDLVLVVAIVANMVIKPGA